MAAWALLAGPEREMGLRDDVAGPREEGKKREPRDEGAGRLGRKPREGRGSKRNPFSIS